MALDAPNLSSAAFYRRAITLLNDRLLCSQLRRKFHNVFCDNMADDMASVKDIPPDSTCPICFDLLDDSSHARSGRLRWGGLAPKKTPCNHLFHQCCLGRWFATRTTCPVCRAEIVEPSSIMTSRDPDIPANEADEEEELDLFIAQLPMDL